MLISLIKEFALYNLNVQYLIFNYVMDNLSLAQQFVIIEDHFTQPSVSYPFRYKTQTELRRLHTIDNHAMYSSRSFMYALM